MVGDVSDWAGQCYATSVSLERKVAMSSHRSSLLVSLVSLSFVFLLLVGTVNAADPLVQTNVALDGEAAPGTPQSVVFADLAAPFGFLPSPVAS